MNDYVFDIKFPGGEILRDIVCAESNSVGEMIMAERYPEAINIEFIDVH